MMITVYGCSCYWFQYVPRLLITVNRWTVALLRCFGCFQGIRSGQLHRSDRYDNGSRCANTSYQERNTIERMNRETEREEESWIAKETVREQHLPKLHCCIANKGDDLHYIHMDCLWLDTKPDHQGCVALQLSHRRARTHKFKTFWKTFFNGKNCRSGYVRHGWGLFIITCRFRSNEIQLSIHSPC